MSDTLPEPVEEESSFLEFNLFGDLLDEIDTGNSIIQKKKQEKRKKWMKKGNFELNEIKIEMAKYPFATSQIKYLPRCNKIRIGADDLDTSNWWFQKIPEQLVDLQFMLYSEEEEDFTPPSDFLNAPQIMQASNFSFWSRAAFTDEQFLKLKAKSIRFCSVDVSDNGINQFIKKWVNGKGTDDFKEAHLWSPRNRNPVELIRGLEVQQWDNSFEEETCGFVEDFSRCRGRGQCFQIKSRIDPFESLTLSIHSDRVSIYATGKRMEYRGAAYTYYSIPYSVFF
ncbi:hypothetical protein CAEBREN_01209 [Caenorhabditis brenneri]|uniref:Sdz-33 F-box domain-containing protein n=1 Tax=Caenorhabditis brenneri TaxID=135651 RepID=G0MGH9_CAEBE|nr:hypothetical protein CAEBREN_01209 [Caenorhabditis brenneri]